MKKPKVQTVQTTRDLPCILNDDEIRLYGRKLADLEHHREQVALKKKAAVGGFKVELDAIDAGIRDLVTAIRDGMDRREVPCEWVYHWESFAKELMRTDTGGIIERDMIGDDERQIGLDGIDNNAP